MEDLEIKPDISQVIEAVDKGKFHFCGDCNKVCMSKRAYKNHLRSNQHLQKDDGSHCAECNTTYSSRFNLQIHLASKTHVSVKRFLCGFCPKRFSTQVYLKRHKLIHHTNWNALHQCKQCWRRFARQSDYLQHVNRHTEKQVTCTNCKRSFASNNYLISHKCGKGYECHCFKSFRTPKGLRLHQETHKVEKHYECEVCGKSFAVKRYLQAHSRYHRDIIESAFCNICFKKFPHKTSLRIHMKIHMELHCNVCTLSFNSRSELAKHKRIHKMLHVCDPCGRSFANPFRLKRHKLIHDKDGIVGQGEKKTCDQCKKSFSSSTNLSRHLIRKHSKISLKQCLKCNKSFTNEWDLTLHAKVHQPIHITFNDSPGLLGYFNYSSSCVQF